MIALPATLLLAARVHPPPPPVSPKVPVQPPNRWGPFAGRKTELAPEYSFISGFGLQCAWGVVEQTRGSFNFSACEALVDIARENGNYVVLNPETGEAAPQDWLQKEDDVPSVEVCFKPDKKGKCEYTRNYPYYLAPNYVVRWRLYMKALHDWIAGLKPNAEGIPVVQSVQVSLGSTGDITPWHGDPKNSKYAIDSDTWKEFWVNGSSDMVDIFRDLLPYTKLLFNGLPTNSTPAPWDPDAKNWPAYHNLVFEDLKPPNFDIKQGVVSHEYMTTNELDDYEMSGNLTRFAWTGTDGKVEFVRSRGESSDGNPKSGPGLGFWKNPTWNILAMICWDMTYGLDVYNANPQLWSEEDAPKGYEKFIPTMWNAFMFMHTHAGQKDATKAPGAWLQLRDQLDVSDTVRFPEAEFGNATLTNADRFKKIVAAFANMGAGVDDLDAAMASRHTSRNRVGLNQAGWRIWPTNYGYSMKQIDPASTSVGRWRVGSTASLLGQNTRQTVPGQPMAFGLAKGLSFNASSADANGTSVAVHVRVAFFDEGKGSWALQYASAQGRNKTAITVTKKNTKEFAEIRVVIPDLACCAAGQDTPVLFLVDSDDASAVAKLQGKEEKVLVEEEAGKKADPDTFALIEVLRTPFLYQMAENVV